MLEVRAVSTFSALICTLISFSLTTHLLAIVKSNFEVNTRQDEFLSDKLYAYEDMHTHKEGNQN